MERPAADDGFGDFARRRAAAIAADLRSRESPATLGLLALVAVVFAQQVVVARSHGVPIEAVVGHVFLERTRAAWLLSTLLHRSVPHVAANVAMLALLGRVVEDVTPTPHYLGVLLAAAVVSTLGGVLFTATFTDGPVAVYGASGLGYALATHSLWLPAVAAGSVRAGYRVEHLLEELRPAEELVVLVGAAAVLHVALDVVTGPFLTAEWLNGGHAGGALVGLVAGAVHFVRTGAGE